MTALIILGVVALLGISIAAMRGGGSRRRGDGVAAAAAPFLPFVDGESRLGGQAGGVAPTSDRDDATRSFDSGTSFDSSGNDASGAVDVGGGAGE